MNFLPFDITPNLTPAQLEVTAWVKECRTYLAGRNPGEVAYMAVLAGFNLQDVCAALSNVDAKAAFQMWHFDRTLENVRKMRADLERVPELDLMPLWLDLVAQTVTGEHLADL